MRLYLVRHGHAKSENVDPERHLSDIGARETQKVAALLKPLHPSVAAIWHSGKPRAAETAGILATVVKAERGLLEHRDLSPLDAILSVKRELARTKGDLMIVGHLPFLARLAADLLAGREEAEFVALEPSSIACLERNDEGKWLLAWLVTPQLLK